MYQPTSGQKTFSCIVRSCAQQSLRVLLLGVSSTEIENQGLAPVIDAPCAPVPVVGIHVVVIATSSGASLPQCLTTTARVQPAAHGKHEQAHTHHRRAPASSCPSI